MMKPNNKPELSSYKRKNMTEEEIEAYYTDIDEDGYKLIGTSYCCNEAIEIRKHTDPMKADLFKVWNNWDEREDYAANETQLQNILEELRDEIETDASYYEEEDDD